jgi:PAS domain-containing protein
LTAWEEILGWYGNDTDIHGRKQAGENARQRKMEVRRITDAIPQAITVSGSEGNVLYANREEIDKASMFVDVRGDPWKLFRPADGAF